MLRDPCRRSGTGPASRRWSRHRSAPRLFPVSSSPCSRRSRHSASIRSRGIVPIRRRSRGRRAAQTGPDADLIPARRARARPSPAAIAAVRTRIIRLKARSRSRPLRSRKGKDSQTSPSDPARPNAGRRIVSSSAWVLNLGGGRSCRPADGGCREGPDAGLDRTIPLPARAGQAIRPARAGLAPIASSPGFPRPAGRLRGTARGRAPSRG